MGSNPSQEPQEVRWIQCTQGGQREAFGFLVERYQRRIYSLVFRIVGKRHDVEDLVQEIFIKAFRAINSYHFQSSFGTWLARVAVNHCYDYLRKDRISHITYHWQMTEERVRQIEARGESLEGRPQDAAQQAVVRDLVGKLLASAPADDRVILGLKELEGLSVEEIVEILDLKPSTVKVRLHRARKRMLADWQRLSQGR